MTFYTIIMLKITSFKAFLFQLGEKTVTALESLRMQNQRESNCHTPISKKKKTVSGHLKVNNKNLSAYCFAEPEYSPHLYGILK